MSSLIAPFAALRAAPGRLVDVIAPPYDVLNTEEARSLAEERPWSFLHLSKPEIDLPYDADPYSEEAYAKAAENMSRFIASGILKQDEQPCYYVYRLSVGQHTQTGLAAVASVAAYDSQRIRRHEFTRPDKEEDRVRHIDTLNAQTGPALLVYPDTPHIDAVLRQISSEEPDADALADSGVRHTLWVIREESTITHITQYFDALPTLYIADGHHRSAAASRVAAARADKHPHYFLSVLFPQSQMCILDYNRVIRDLNGLNESFFLHLLSRIFHIELVTAPFKPTKRGEFGLYLSGKWRKLTIRSEWIPSDVVGRLDVSVLQSHVIGPILGITDPRRDTRIDFVGGIRGLSELEKRVDSGEMKTAFSLYPTPIDELIAVADKGLIMPPKSTWFEPKLADGVVSFLLE